MDILLAAIKRRRSDGKSATTFSKHDFQRGGAACAVAQFERSLIAERVKSGLANARATGKILGRTPLREFTRNEVTDLRRSRTKGKVTFPALAKTFGSDNP